MKIKSTLFAAMLAVACVTWTNAQEDQTEQCEGTGPVAKAMGDLPKMSYKVGEESVCCADAAAELAKKNSLPIHYVVAENAFDSKEAAMGSLVEHTEKYVNEFLTPCKCEVSGATKIAGKACNCPVESGKRAEMVKAAAAKVQMSYQVGEKSCNCPNEAAALAKAHDAEKFFVVNEEKTCCEMTARLNLARAKYKAAVQALAAAEKTTEKAGS